MLSTRIDQIVKRRQEAESGISRRIEKATTWKNYVEGLLSICKGKRATWNLVLQDSKSTDQALVLEEHLQSFVEQVKTLLDEELVRMGADIKVDGRVAVVIGKSELTGAKVVARELRGGASLVVAALAAEGITEIENVKYIDRGYESIERVLSLCGIDIKRKE